jgi:hypothetical protein
MRFNKICAVFQAFELNVWPILIHLLGMAATGWTSKCVPWKTTVVSIAVSADILSQTCITFRARVPTYLSWVYRVNMSHICRICKTSCPKPASPSDPGFPQTWAGCIGLICHLSAGFAEHHVPNLHHLQSQGFHRPQLGVRVNIQTCITFRARVPQTSAGCKG